MSYIHIDTLSDLRIDYAANPKGGKMASMHCHNVYEIYILEKGKRNYLIGGNIFSLCEREVALIKPFELHSTEGSAYSRYILYFNENYLDRYFSAEGKEILLSLFSQKKLTLDEDSYSRICEFIVALNKKRGDFLLFAEILRLLLSCRDVPSRQENGKGTFIASITEYIGHNYLDITGLDELSSRFFITKPHLCRLFKRETGLSVITYINAKKLQLAADELRFSRKSIKKIAADCGFHSSMYFCKLFHETFALSPSEYRKSRQI